MNIDHFISKLHAAQNIVITTHTFPDADGIGSEIGLAMALRSMNKNVFCVNEEQLLGRYDYLDPERLVISADMFLQQKPMANIDLFITVDTNSFSRIGTKMSEIAKTANQQVFIDHHPLKESPRKEDLIDTEAAATGELVGSIIEALGVEFTKEMALPLYTAILIDTSSFRYPTVRANTHRLISKFLSTGIQAAVAYNGIYGTRKISHMRLLGTILSSASMNQKENISWIVVKEEDLLHFDIDPEDTHAFINHLLVLENSRVALMFRNIDQTVKISLRSDGIIDVGVIATALGGGGHNHSAATIIEGELKDVIDKTIPRIEELIEQQQQQKR